MRTRCFRGRLVAGALTLVLLGGCVAQPEVPPAMSWGIKALNGEFTATTPEEWQAVAEKLNSRAPEADLTLSEDGAEIIVDFLQLNDLDSIQDAVNLVQQAKNDPSVLDELKLPAGATPGQLPEVVEQIFGALAGTDVAAFVKDLAGGGG